VRVVNIVFSLVANMTGRLGRVLAALGEKLIVGGIAHEEN
jgi:hypothetical protein